MFYSFIRPPCCCQCKNQTLFENLTNKDYDLYHQTFTTLLSNVSSNQTKNETLATHLCEYFDIKKPQDKTDIIDIVTLIKEQQSNKSVNISMDDVLKVLKETPEAAPIAKTVESLIDLGKNIDREKSAENVVNLFSNLVKTLLVPQEKKETTEQTTIN